MIVEQEVELQSINLQIEENNYENADNFDDAFENYTSCLNTEYKNYSKKLCVEYKNYLEKINSLNKENSEQQINEQKCLTDKFNEYRQYSYGLETCFKEYANNTALLTSAYNKNIKQIYQTRELNHTLVTLRDTLLRFTIGITSYVVRKLSSIRHIF